MVYRTVKGTLSTKLCPAEPTLSNEILKFATQTGREAVGPFGLLQPEPHFLVVHDDSENQVLTDAR